VPTSPPDSAETNRLLRSTSEARTGQPRIWTRTEANCEPLKFGHARNLRRPIAAQTPLTGLSRAAAAEAPNPTFEQRFGHTLNDERVSPEALENTAPSALRLGPGPVPPSPLRSFQPSYYFLLPLPPWRSSSPQPNNPALAGADPTGPKTAAQNRSRASPPSGTSQIVCVHKRRPRVRPPATRHKSGG
jgi:hypothetical protein